MSHPIQPTIAPTPGDQAAPHLAVVEPAPLVGRWTQPRTADGAYIAIDRRSLPALTSLRFFAALYVVLHHLINLALLNTQGADADRASTWYFAWATQGHVGVTFFFVLSGFILAWCYHQAFAIDDRERRTATTRRFWFARFARVWPLHAAMFVAFIPIVLQKSGLAFNTLFTTAWEGALNLLLLHAWVPGGGADGRSDTFNGPSWTLSVEALYYLMFPLLAILLVGRLRWGVGQLGFLIVGSWLTLGALGGLLADAGDAGDWVMRVFPPARLPDFVIGVALGLIVVQGLQRARVLGVDRPRTLSVRWTALEAFALAGACLSPLVWALAASDVLPGNLGMSWFHLPTIIAAIGVISLERGAISQRLLASRPLVWLGEVSYALYLTHLFFLLAANQLGAYDRLGAWTTSIALLVLTIIVAGVVHERFEKPARAFLVGRRDARASPPSAQES